MPIPAILHNRLSLPIIASPMFIISTPELVIAECKAGIVGSFPALNARPAGELDKWLTRIETELAACQAEHPDRKVAPFAVNQICHKTNDRLRHDADVCTAHRVPIIITSLQADSYVIEQAHSYGGIVLHDATNIRHARKALEQGVDGLILVCAGAGGHAGTLSPLALVSEVRTFYDGPILLSGAIANGASILAAQAMGADMAYMGTRFIATEEANADPAYKQMLIDSAAEDIVYSSLFSGVPANYLKDSVRRSGLDPDNLPSADKSTMNFGSGGNTDAKVWRDIWGAGHGTGSIGQAPSVADCVAQLRREYDAAVVSLRARQF
jgi:nitronate monooxygenase